MFLKEFDLGMLSLAVLGMNRFEIKEEIISGFSISEYLLQEVVCEDEKRRLFRPETPLIGGRD